MANDVVHLRPRGPGGPPVQRRFSLFALGFRPFFLLAGAMAALWMLVWVAMLEGAAPTALANPVVWHAHEMVFGYTVAVIAGFLLTAVRNWTGVPTPTGAPLAGLALLWIAGRLGMLAGDALPGPLVAAVELAFLPALAFAVARPIVRAKNYRNLGFVPLLLAMAAGNAVCHFAAPDWAMRGVYLALHAVVLIIVVVGGRIIPLFSANALGTPSRKSQVADWGAFISVAVYAAAHFAGLPAPVLAAAAGTAALFNLARMAGWQSWRSRNEPILAVLHLGYLWVPAGFALQAAALATGLVPATAATHALTAGAIGALTLGMMSRVALGHSGRPIHASPAVVASYALLTLAALVRVLGPAVTGELAQVYRVSGGLWAAAFALFVWSYARILVTPRVDGKPG